MSNHTRRSDAIAIHPLIPESLPRERVAAGFTTRLGGVSRPPFDSLNLGTRAKDSAANVAENHRRLYRYLGIEGPDAAFMGQVHDAIVRVVSWGGMYPETDGLLTAEAGLMLGVRTADCVPMLLHDPVRNVVGAIHGGWQPVTMGIIENAMGTLWSELDSRPADLRAVLGPSAGPCCYEVKADVADLLAPSAVIERKGRLYADLRVEITVRLTGFGVAPDHIEVMPGCTICNPDLYFSHRRDGHRSGRMVGFIMLQRSDT